MNKYPESIDKITKARLRFSALGSVFSIALAMFFCGVMVFFAFFSYQFIQNIPQKFKMEILFYSDVKEADIVAYEQKIKLEPYVSSSNFSSRADNIEIAKKEVGQNFLEIIESPINASVFISLNSAYANSDSLTIITKKLKQNLIIQDVVYPDIIVKSVLNNLLTIVLVIVGISAIFILIAILLIANLIRLNIYAKRLNIRSMLLVGATRNFVRKPFIMKGFIQGVWGGILAVIMLAFVLYAGNYFLPEFVDFSYIDILALFLVAILAFSIVFTILIALFSVNKYIKINRDQLYL